MFIVNEFLNGVWKGYWSCASEQEARDIIDTLKIGRLYYTYNIEHPNGYVIDVFKPLKNS